MTTTTLQHRTTDLPHDDPEPRPRRSRNAVRLSLAALALSLGIGAAYASSDGTSDDTTGEWTSEDGLRWEHPDGRSYVVATPQSIPDR